LIFEEFKIEVEPLTPIFVWSGEILHKGADFYTVNGKIIIADIFKALGKVRDLSEVFKEEFARTLLGTKLIFSSNLNPRQILMPNEYLIPASSLKGLIRTALLDNLSKSSPEVYNNVKSKLDELPTKEARKEMKQVGEPVEELLRHTVAFNERKYKYDALNRLLIKEPEISGPLLTLRKVLILELVGNFEGKKFMITLDKGKLTYDIKIMKPSNYGVNPNLKGLDDMINKGNIATCLKDFSVRLVSSEKSKIKSTHKDVKKYLEFLNNLKIEGDCAPLRIGMLTGYQAKTVGLPPDVDNLRARVMTHLTGHLWDNRTVKLADGIGVGWIKLCVR